MKVKVITFTGADDSVRAADIVAISQVFPFVEWGILLSATQEGGSRFPSLAWMNGLAELSEGLDVSLSGHLCGRWLRDLLIGQWMFQHRRIQKAFQRMQLNFHADTLTINKPLFHQVLRGLGKEIIFQVDGRNEAVYREASDAGIKAYPFFDLSHGAGVLPEGWEVPLDNQYCGYAGGLGPDNLESQLKGIAEAAGDRTIWIDMETQVRSNSGARFDIDKAMRCIEIVKPYVEIKKAP